MENEKLSVNFREQAVNNVFSQNEKPFFVRAPNKLSTYTFFATLLGLFLFASLYIIHLPVHVKAYGEVLAGNEYHQIVINQDDMVVSNIFTELGSNVSPGQLIIQLKGRDGFATQSAITDHEIQIAHLKETLKQIKSTHQQEIMNFGLKNRDQHAIIKQLKKEIERENDVLKRSRQNIKLGLIPGTHIDNQLRIISGLETSLLKEVSNITSLKIDKLATINEFNIQSNKNHEQIDRLNVALNTIKEGLNILSPCECTVDNILTKENIPVNAGQSILSLSSVTDSYSMILYIPSREYKELQIGRELKVNVASYPSAKYGPLVASVTEVSASPVLGSMLSSNGSAESNTSYFVVKAEITSTPNSVSLITGMVINSDIKMDNNSLFDLIFNFGR